MAALTAPSRWPARFVADGPQWMDAPRIGRPVNSIRNGKEIRQHASLDIKPLSNTDRDRYDQQWTLIQQQFVEQPADAVTEADQPAKGYRRQVADLSVRRVGPRISATTGRISTAC
jgi:hypothetical protein